MSGPSDKVAVTRGAGLTGSHVVDLLVRERQQRHAIMLSLCHEVPDDAIEHGVAALRDACGRQ